MRMLGLVLVAGVLSACASGRADPSLDADAKLFRAPADSACIYVVPSSNIAAVTVTLDGRKVGTLGMENYLRLKVTPGRHVLSVTRDNLVPKPATAISSARPGQTPERIGGSIASTGTDCPRTRGGGRSMCAGSCCRRSRCGGVVSQEQRPKRKVVLRLFWCPVSRKVSQDNAGRPGSHCVPRSAERRIPHVSGTRSHRRTDCVEGSER
jgi:hypothetical protein